MDKGQALYNFWSKFGLPAYEENTVPEDSGDRYITYSVQFGNLDDVINLYGNIWDYNSHSWEFVDKKAQEISEYIEKKHPISYGIDNGRLYIAAGKPFAQHMSDPNSDLVRRVYINIQAEFLTAY